MKQFLLREQPDKDGYVRLKDHDYHYLAQVRRARPGDSFPALLPGGARVYLEIRKIEGRAVYARCVIPAPTHHNGAPQSMPSAPQSVPQSMPQSMPSAPPLYLFQSVPKGAKLDLIVRQATEAGAAAIIPFYSEHCQAQPSRGGSRHARLEKIIREARQQSGSAVDTKLEAALDFNGMLARWLSLKQAFSNPAALLMHEAPLGEASLHSLLADKPDAVAAAVGPEGGFSRGETQRFIDAGFTPIILGSTILRTETAALYTLAAICAVLLERETWIAAKK